MSAINKDSHTENNNRRFDNTEPHTSLNGPAGRTNEARQTNGMQQSGSGGERQNQPAPTPAALPAGQWLRMVLGFEAPFGHDGLPTVWG